MGLSEYMINEEAFDYSSFIELLYKNESKGYISLFRKGFTGIFQKAYKKNDLFKGVKNFFDTEFNTDLYMSMNTFYKPERTKENLRYLNSLYIDLDYYKMNLNRQEVLSKLEEEYFNKSIPVPSMIPSKAVNLWSAMQHYLYDKLKDLGADRQALDPSRILRVIGSYNTKSNTNVKLLRFEFVRYTLKKLKEMYLPKVTKKLEAKKKAFKGFNGSFYKDTKQNKKLRKDTMEVLYPVDYDALALTYTDSNGKKFQAPVIANAANYSASLKYCAYIASDNPFTVIKNKNKKDGSSCVVIKESFGNAFVPFLADHYQNVYVIDYRYWNGKLQDFIRRKKCNDVLFVNNMSMTRNSYLVTKLSQIL